MGDYTLAQNILFATTISAKQDGKKYRFFGLDGKYSALGKKAVGITNRNFNNGAEIGVSVAGMLIIEAGAAITVLDEPLPVTSDVEGRAILATDPTHKINGYAIQSAVAAGEQILILRNI